MITHMTVRQDIEPTRTVYRYNATVQGDREAERSTAITNLHLSQGICTPNNPNNQSYL